MTLVIMAAGMGSRFGGLKQIEPIEPNKEFIIDYSVYDAIRSGFNKIVFIIKEENYELFKNTISTRVDKYIDVEYVFQKNDNVPVIIPKDRIKPLGTAHAILCCKDIVKENFAIINADDFYGYDAYKAISEFLKNNNDENEYAMVGYKVSNTLTSNGAVKRGVCEVENGYLNKLIESNIDTVNDEIYATSLEENEKVEINSDTTVSMNMFGFTPKIFEYLENRFESFLNENDLNKCEYLIPSVVSEMIEKGIVNVKVLETTAKWYGITYKEDKELLEKEIAKLIDNGEYPNNLWIN